MTAAPRVAGQRRPTAQALATPNPALTRELGYAAPNAMGWWLIASTEQTPELRWPLSVQVYDRMRRTDSQVRSVLRAVTLPVRRTTWWVDQADASDEVARFVADNLGLDIAGAKPGSFAGKRVRDRFSWSEHVAQALQMIVYGHSFFEQVYRIGDDGRAWIRKLAPRLPHTIYSINVAPDGGLTSIEQYGVVGKDTGMVTIPVERLVAYVHEREGGNWVGESLLRSGYKHWLIKDRLLRVDAETIERNGMGIPIYKATPSGADMETGRQFAQGFRAGPNAGGAIPDGAEFTLRGVEGSLPQALPSIRYHDEQIGRSVLAHFLNLGQGQPGSWALGTAFADFFTMSLQTLAQQVADVATQHIVEDLVDINFGPDVPAPRVTFQEIGSRSAVTAEAIALLVNSGVLLREPALERYVRETYGIPDKEPLPGQDGYSQPPADQTTTTDGGQ